MVVNFYLEVIQKFNLKILFQDKPTEKSFIVINRTQFKIIFDPLFLLCNIILLEPLCKGL